MNKVNKATDFLIVGSGLAGLFAAWTASKYGSVLIVTKANFDDSNSWLAQGGIAVALAEQTTDSHFKDTIIAGRNLCNEKAVKILVDEGVDRVKELIELGMPFDKENGEISQGLEGGHSKRRVIHSNGSSTGQEVIKFLLKRIIENPKITILNETHSIKIISKDNTALGMLAYSEITNNLITINSKVTILATGGYSRIYSRNTNPNAAIGEGIWMAEAVGVEIRDMEFMQFHPTAFYSETGETFLISEAVRGEGAFLLDKNKERFMQRYSPLMELAPRDLVAKAIFTEISKSSKEFVYLDLRHLNADKIKSHFNNIYNFAKKFNCDITSELVPVAPAAHYSVGGIKTDLNGSTNIKNLFACGETASTGVHGANRLASNSLLECLVFSKRAALKAAENIDNIDNIESIIYTQTDPDSEYYLSSDGASEFERIRKIVSQLFENKVGILRNKEKLKKAEDKLNELAGSIPKNTKEINLKRAKGVIGIGLLIVQSCLERKESRGCHQREDYPESSNNFVGNFTTQNKNIKFEKLNYE